MRHFPPRKLRRSLHAAGDHRFCIPAAERYVAGLTSGRRFLPGPGQTEISPDGSVTTHREWIDVTSMFVEERVIYKTREVHR